MHRELVDARKGRWRATWAGHVPRQRSAPGASRHRDASARPLRRLRRIGLAILGLQLLGLGAWSALLYHRFALTWDFAVYHQPWYLIAHGNLDPPTSCRLRLDVRSRWAVAAGRGCAMAGRHGPGTSSRQPVDLVVGVLRLPLGVGRAALRGPAG